MIEMLFTGDYLDWKSLMNNLIPFVGENTALSLAVILKFSLSIAIPVGIITTVYNGIKILDKMIN